ncbi:hypothetical protein PRUPE_6G172400 [Prunus persica]|uniref:Uncharacterized protein n=1 Tax=Prunus persica TaxID=3760 RepID=A0A251NRQ5_PRUPE|nr:hypothetical protein PRUPE_6G172400 [Prunus persica]
MFGTFMSSSKHVKQTCHCDGVKYPSCARVIAYLNMKKNLEKIMLENLHILSDKHVTCKIYFLAKYKISLINHEVYKRLLIGEIKLNM